MKNILKYKECTGSVEYSEEDGCLFGRILGIADIISYEGESVAEIKTAFEEVVDDYLVYCASIEKAPNKAYSGKVMLRVLPELHAEMAMRAKAAHMSLNQWVTEILSRA